MPRDKEGLSSLEQMRAKRNSSVSIFKQFTECRNSFATHAFCFYEGEDSKYFHSRIKPYWGDKTIYLRAGNKKEVCWAMNRITSDPLYSEVCVMFFVDRDYDESIAGTNPDLFETPCYSIENLYAQESVLAQILHVEFGLNTIDPDFQKCMTDYRLRLNEFNQIIVKLNAILKYQHLYAPDKKCQINGLSTTKLTDILITGVSKSINCDQIINNLISQINPDYEILSEIEQGFLSDSDINLIFRGKNQLDFFVAMIKIFKNLSNSHSYFDARLPKVNLEITNNRLSQLSQYAVTPPELTTFLENHRPAS